MSDTQTPPRHEPELPDGRRRLRSDPIKRAIDAVGAAALLLLLSPLMLAIAALVRATSRGPALFRQQRIGEDREPFQILKFRTMTSSDDDSAHREAIRQELAGEAAPGEDGSFKTAESSRITVVGQWLRRTSLDELPQLVNVLLGEMALVGPRPALDWEVEMFPPEYSSRAEVRPGLTGLWQVSGRGWLSTLDMLRLDVEYVETRSLRLDLWILLRTLPVIVRSDGTR